MVSSSTEYTSSKASSRNDEDAAVEKLSQHLAELNSKFCDQFSRQLEQVFTATIPDFPRLERPDALIQRLEKSHLRNVDVVEVYASRNIFTLDNLPVNRRGRIAQLFFSTNKPSDVTLVLKKETPQSLTNSPNDSSSNLDNVTSKPPITKKQVETKREAVKELQQKLAAAKQQRDALQRRVGELEVAQNLANWKNDPVSTAEHVQTTASTLMEDVHGLTECQAKGQEAKQQAKKRRVEEETSSDQEDNGDGLNSWNPLASKTTNVHDLYHKEQKRVQTTKEDLQGLHRMLVGDKNNN